MIRDGLTPPDVVLQHANCAGTPTDLFDVRSNTYRGRNALRAQRRTHAPALALCAACTVRSECAEWALSDPNAAYGLIAGGLLPAERTQIAKRRA